MTDAHKTGQEDPPGHQASGDWLHQTLDELSTSLRPGGFAAPGEPSGRVTMVGPDSCPDPGVWLHLAINELPKDESEKLLAHAAMCANCLQRLRQSRQTLALEATPEDAVDPKVFESSSANWQRQFALRLAETPRKSAVRSIPGFVWWTTGALLFTLLLAFVFNSWWKAHNSPAHLLNEAYSHARSFDLRIPGAHYAPVLPQSQSHSAQPSQLLTARQLIADGLRKHPGDPQLLHLQARADLLAGQYDAAIGILDQLLVNGPVTASLLTDDATAYFQRGLANGSQNDRTTALENLRRADALDPNNPVILFNEAIVLKEDGMVSNAIEVWNRFLSAEHDPQWLAEGHRRLQRLEQVQSRLHEKSDRIRPRPLRPCRAFLFA